jgi:hypothetical protein
VIAAIVFGIVGFLLVYYEESTGFANGQIIELIVNAIGAIFLLVVLARSRKRRSADENRVGSSTSSDAKISPENSPSPEIRSFQRGILIFAMIAELFFGVWIFIITEGETDNWLLSLIFVGCALSIVLFGRYSRTW